MEDNHEPKRHEQIARTLAESYIIIRVILRNLDEIRLHLHSGLDLRERLAEDLMMVARDILPTVEADREILSIIRSALVDWIVLNDLISLAQATGDTPRRLQTAEEITERLLATLDILAETEPGLFEDTE